MGRKKPIAALTVLAGLCLGQASYGADAASDGSVESLWNEQTASGKTATEAHAPLCTVESFKQSSLVQTGAWPGLGPFKGQGAEYTDVAQNKLTLEIVRDRLTSAQMAVADRPKQLVKLQVVVDFLLESLGAPAGKIADFNTQLSKSHSELTASSDKNPLSLTAGRYLVHIFPESAHNDLVNFVVKIDSNQADVPQAAASPPPVASAPRPTKVATTAPSQSATPSGVTDTVPDWPSATASQPVTTTPVSPATRSAASATGSASATSTGTAKPNNQSTTASQISSKSAPDTTNTSASETAPLEYTDKVSKHKKNSSKKSHQSHAVASSDVDTTSSQTAMTGHTPSPDLSESPTISSASSEPTAAADVPTLPVTSGAPTTPATSVASAPLTAATAHTSAPDNISTQSPNPATDGTNSDGNEVMASAVVPQRSAVPASSAPPLTTATTAPTSATAAAPDILKNEFAGLLNRWQLIKRGAVSKRDTSSLSDVLSGAALTRQMEAVQWLVNRNMHYDLSAKNVNVDRYTELSPGERFSVFAQITELSKLIDDSKNAVIKDTTNTYNVNYTIERINGHWAITDSAIVNTPPSQQKSMAKTSNDASR